MDVLGSQGEGAPGLCGDEGAVLRISAGGLLAEAPSLVARELSSGPGSRPTKGPCGDS